MTSRDLLMAQLAVERAHLLHTLLGISKADLTGTPVVADWTAANILAHIGDWDRFYMWRIEKVLEGSAPAIPSIAGPDERNPSVHAAIRGFTLDESVRELESARVAFLTMLSQVDDKTLSRSYEVQWGTVKIRTWALWRAKHDFNHTKDLRQWRRKLKTTSQGWDLPSSVLRAALKAACNDFIVTVRQIAHEQGDCLIEEGVTLTEVVRRTANAQITAIAQLRGMPMQERAPAEITYAQAWQTFRRSYVVIEDMLVNMVEADLTPISYKVIAMASEMLMREAALIRASLGVRWPKRLLTFKGLYTNI